jgi:hypothetical protein
MFSATAPSTAIATRDFEVLHDTLEITGYSGPTLTATFHQEPELAVPAWYEFHRLKDLWRRERGATSSITAMATCPSYQGIIGMGEIAVPLILRELESEGDQPDMWFWALKAITRDDPVNPDDRGDMKAMADAWLSWGEDRYAW